MSSSEPTTTHRGELSLPVIEEVIRGHDPAEAASVLYWRIFGVLRESGALSAGMGVQGELEQLRVLRAAAVRSMLDAEDRELVALAEVDDLRDEVEQLKGRRAAVLELHAPDSMGLCGHCGHTVPCPTATAVQA